MRASALVAFTAVLTLVLTAGGDARGHRACERPHTKTLKRTAAVRVFQDVEVGNVSACLYSRDRVVDLQFFGEFIDQCSSLQNELEIAGRYVAYDMQVSGCDADAHAQDLRVIVRNLRTRKTLTKRCSDQVTNPTGGCGSEVSDIELRSNGSVAWLTYVDPANTFPGDPPERLFKREVKHRVKRLDQASDLRRLRLIRKRLFWMNGSSRRSATLR